MRPRFATGAHASGGGSEGAGGDSGRVGQESEPGVEKPQAAAVEAALKAQLEAALLQLNVETIDCTRQGEDFTCRVRGISAGQPRSGRLTLTAQGNAGTRFLGRESWRALGATSRSLES